MLGEALNPRALKLFILGLRREVVRFRRILDWRLWVNSDSILLYNLLPPNSWVVHPRIQMQADRVQTKEGFRPRTVAVSKLADQEHDPSIAERSSGPFWAPSHRPAGAPRLRPFDPSTSRPFDPSRPRQRSPEVPWGSDQSGSERGACWDRWDVGTKNARS